MADYQKHIEWLQAKQTKLQAKKDVAPKRETVLVNEGKTKKTRVVQTQDNLRKSLRKVRKRIARLQAIQKQG